MEVRKSDGSYEEYSAEKVKSSICEAYKAVGEDCNEVILAAISNGLYIYDKVSTDEIERQISEALMSFNKKVAKAYIDKAKDNQALKKNNDFVKNYIESLNAASGSKYDANSNVSHKNIVTLGQEIHKGENIQQNRYIMHNKIKALYSKKLADNYISDLESHVLYKHDESGTPGYPYCVAITMFPFLVDGLTKLGGPSKKPTDLKSYCGEFINLVYSVSSQFMGAVATPEFLMYMDYFIRLDYGDDYLEKLNEKVELNRKGRTLEEVIENYFQQVVHSMNMPAGNRGYQTVFWNVGYFDKSYFEGVFGDFSFPDGTKPKWETLSWLQKKFMKWFNKERTLYAPLTFPVETMAMLTDGNDVLDEEYADFTAEMWAEGHSFFCYLSDSPDSLSSCCRLRSGLKELETNDSEHNHTTHQFSMGTASVSTGSKSVMTVNLNRVIQNAVKRYFKEVENKEINLSEGLAKGNFKEEIYAWIRKDLTEIVERVHKYQTAFNAIIKDFYNAKMLDVYSAGFIDMRRQYLTVGVNGLTDAAEFCGFDITINDGYKRFVNEILETINKCNKADKTKDCMFNTEFVPGENLSNKNRKWDKEDGYYVSEKHNMYSSYFFNPEDTSLSVLDKIKLHGDDFVKWCDGGQAAHINLGGHLSKEQYRQLLKVAAKENCNYFTFNVKNTVCNECGYISKDTLDTCPKCGSKNLDYLTRVIGYMIRVSSMPSARQEEESHRYYEMLKKNEED